MEKLKLRRVTALGDKYWVVVNGIGERMDDEYFFYKEDAQEHLKEVQQFLKEMEVE